MAREMIRAASCRTPLRAFYPYISLERWLRFSRTEEWPYSEVGPRIRCPDPKYDLEGPAYVVWSPTEPPKRLPDLEQALDAVIRLLPQSDTR
jgi:hypothetical protein